MNLQYWRQPQKISRRVAREVLTLSEYNVEIHHIQGKKNGRAEALSRRPDYDKGTRDNEHVTVLPDRIFVRTATIGEIERNDIGEFTVHPTTVDIPYIQQDEEILRAWVDPDPLHKVQGTWYKEGKRVVTSGLTAKRKIIRDHHDSPTYGHPGIKRTQDLIERYYWWPRMKMDVLMYVKGCAECQRMKSNTHPTKAPLQPIFPKPEALPFATVTMDLIMKLPISQGYNSILTVTDHNCTKAVVLIPCQEASTAEDIATLYVKYVFVRFGLPDKFISDRDPRFASKFMQELCQILGIQQNISTAFHPRTDGQSERTNQWVKQYLRFFINDNHDDWVHHLPLAEFVHNNWVSETTKQSPFFLLSGYNPRAD